METHGVVSGSVGLARTTSHALAQAVAVPGAWEGTLLGLSSKEDSTIQPDRKYSILYGSGHGSF